ncbi:antibiotic biosynthesis monooxygenase [Motilimonas cestriensis]|uniref:Antibiotic biosynthesis monooxygenase n=1 Tax=Motilimonas cestriensis TaxID=2742685 RepID=A0ABS8WF11_9GAMM|nr:antibiotic biosynthesis monooxygenase [Motilimonas cestriensis]MCE2596283.1 antibiotic biosynthesis monooxygenase [Motilimonas cestriensis]
MFVVLYQWQLKPERLRYFQEGWTEIVHRNIEKYGALGSKLHKGSDNNWYSYSQWTSKACWEAAFNMDDSHQEARKKMVSAILRNYPPVLMTPILDHLVSDEMITPPYL